MDTQFLPFESEIDTQIYTVLITKDEYLTCVDDNIKEGVLYV